MESRAIVRIAAVLAGVWSLASVAPGAAHAQGEGAHDIVTNTAHVEDVVVDAVAGRAWVATRGGLEVYELAARRRVALYTTAHGLPGTFVHGLRLLDGGGSVTIEARTERHVCRLLAAAARFECEEMPPLPPPAPALASLFQGARVTARVALPGIAGLKGGALVGTAGQGLWLQEPVRPGGVARAPVRLTPADQVCSNHMMAMTEHDGRLYLGSFDEGLCVREGDGYRRLDTPFRMVNDLQSTPAGLYVAASEGLFRSVDGESFEPVPMVTERGVNGLAFDGRSLYATSPATLWRIRVRGGPKSRAYWLPGGSRAVQKVAVGNGAVWLASEDRGVIRLTGNTFQVLDRAAGLPTSWVMDVAVGAGNTVYAATFRHGLLAIDMDGDRPRVRTVAGAPDDWQLHASVHGHALWVGTQNGAMRLNMANPSASAVFTDLPHPCVHAVAHAGGRTWLATEGGLYVLPAPARL